MTLTEQAIQAKQAALLGIIKQVKGQVVLKTYECIMFESTALSDERIEELAQYGEVNITKTADWQHYIERYEVLLQDE